MRARALTQPQRRGITRASGRSAAPDPVHRAGRLYTRQGLLVWDHDFPSWAEGVVVPYSLYDLRRNFGYVSLGTSRDTTEFGPGEQ